MVIEDDRAARLAIEELLRDEGYSVVTAATGAEAERLWQEGRQGIDVVLTDAVMPRMSGPELVQRLRAANPDVKVIFMSGQTPETVLQHGAVTGTAFLHKPFEFDDLVARLRELLAAPRPPAAPVRAAERARLVSRLQLHRRQ